MTVDQLDELIRKYLSTGVAMVLVLVAPATAPSEGTARPESGTHPTSVAPTGRPADPTAAPNNAAALPPGPMHLCIQLDWFPQNAAQSAGGAVTPSQMQVDWVRHYPLDAPSPTPTAAPTSDNSVVHDVIRRTFGW